ncbi:formate dehydrogenase subunit alpha [Mycobacteroides abscessus subsp. massiliense]|uniref:formate dehydrogenase subunit alpha n=1 Tax=Mycobacteroides abscessus TaxID=36809 RepID=UPI0019D2964E|nr:formate dehydrogenase subunit alpha [Mycobacteroides abscessus]MBN7318949.1 formate dehydrogenase subunit alpha [Mycobacteroides abscessus subsp. massiliense]
MIHLNIDGTAIDAPPGTSVLRAAANAGIEIPALCDDPRLAPAGACRLCLVQIDDDDQPVTSCSSDVAEGMTVRTGTPRIRRLRKTLLTMLARTYSATASVTPDLPFHRLLAQYGVQAAGTHYPGLLDLSHPNIRVDLNACVKCWRCVRICEEVQGQFTWRIRGRGDDSHVVPDSGTTLAASSCVSCGACVDTCPTGALADSNTAAAVTDWTRTVCPYCGVGCEMLVGVRDRHIVAISPAHDAPVNRGHLCVKGRYGHGFLTASDRITTPMLRENSGDWKAVEWDEAIAAATDGFQRLIERRGPESVGVLASARATNEENYLTQKFARIALSTNNVDSCARVCHAPSAAGLKTVFGTGAATNSFDDIETARTIFICGSNTTEAHPVVGARIKQAALRGANLVVMDPRRIELADYADVHLRPRPGTNVAALNSLAAAIIDEGVVDEDYVARRVEGFEEFRAFIQAYIPERSERLTGLPATDVRAAARLYGRDKPSMIFHGLGVTEHVQGTDGVICLANLALITGNLGHPGTGINPLRGQNNVQGAAHMGCEPTNLPGMIPISEGRALVETVWKAPIPKRPGLDAIEMLDAAAAGELAGLWVIGWDIQLTQPNTAATQQALAALDVLVVQDLFLTETARQFGTVFLPAASSFEKDGTFMNSERRVQRVRAAMLPPPGARTDAEILSTCAARLGAGKHFSYATAEDVWQEIRQVWAAGAGISYPGLEQPGGLQWPCPSEGHPGTARLHQETFGGYTPRAYLRHVEYCPSVEQPNNPNSFALITGRELYSFNAGTMTARSATAALASPPVLEISSLDAERLGIVNDSLVRVSSRYGQIVLRCHISARVQPGVVFTTFNDPKVAVNSLTGTGRDRHTHTPEYKLTTVNIERVDG